MNAKSGFLFAWYCVLLCFSLFKRNKFVLKLGGHYLWFFCSGNFHIGGRNLNSDVLILKFVLFLEALKFIQTLSHVVNFFHRARVCTLVLCHWVGCCWFLCLNWRWSWDSISWGSCTGVPCLPSTLVQLVLERKNLCLLFSDLPLPLLNLRCNWLVNWYLLLRTRLKSQRRCLRGVHNNISGPFLRIIVWLVLGTLLVLKILFHSIVLAVCSNKTMAAKQLLCVEFILSF